MVFILNTAPWWYRRAADMCPDVDCGILCWTLSLLVLSVLTVTSTSAKTESTDLVEIEIDGKTYEYSMSSTPPVDSPIVVMEKEELQGALDLDSFVKDLARVGSLVKVAYNGIGAAGPEFQDLQNKVQRLGFDISKLCDKSAITVSSFKTTTRTILYELKAAYEFLFKNKEKLAMVSFSLFTELAEKMATAAEKLQHEFEIQEEKVVATLEETKLRGADKKIKISQIREQQEKDKMNMEMQKKHAKEHEKLEAQFREERLRAERKEDKAMSSKSGFLGRLGNAITSHFGLGNLFDDNSDAAAKANRWRQRSIEKLENEKEQRKLKREALQSMAELAHEIKMAEKYEELATIAVEALGKASGSMKQLILVLRQASIFWNQLKDHCRRLGDERVEKFVADFSEEERRDYWTSSQFKQRMFRYISKWVALNSVCSAHLEQIRITQHDLYQYMLEDPTYEESKRNLRALVENFEKDLESAQDRIQQEEFKGTKEIQQLKHEADNNDERKTEL